MATPHFPTQYKCSSVFTHNLTMNQDSADLSVNKFKIQHLPSFFWRTFGTALFGQQTHFIPKQNRNWPRIREFSLVRSRRRKQLFWVAAPPLLRVLFSRLSAQPFHTGCRSSYGHIWQAGGWGGGGSIYLCPLLHQGRWVVTQPVFLSGLLLFLWLDDITSNQQLLSALFREPSWVFCLVWVFFFFTTGPEPGEPGDPWWPLTLLIYRTHTSE